jgi:hypothetical protein
MFRKFLIPLLTAVFLATPAFAPATMTSLSGSALAQKTTPTTNSINLNSSRSNIYKTINPSDQNAINACTGGGGTVGKDPKGQDACITPKRATKATTPTTPTTPAPPSN